MRRTMQNVLVTGANGFVGRALFAKLQDDNIQASALLRKGRDFTRSDFVPVVYFYSAFNDTENLTKALSGIDCVIHCAARVHMMNEKHSNPLEEFRRINTQGTLALASLAASLGVKRFVFLSTIKVLGEETKIGQAYTHSDPLLPEDAYGISKAEAELGLKKIADETGMELVIIRPPLVYGLGVKANFASMMRLASKNLPLPLGAIHNKRSMVSLANLLDLIVTCIDHPMAANQTFLVSDDCDVSVSDLVRELTRASGKRPWLIPVPIRVIQFLAAMIGKKSVADRLCGSLQLDITHTKDTLSWVPPISFKDGIACCFTKEKRNAD